ncbi:xylose-binding protein [Hydrogenispora ethanolica]|uniref:Xylose-binding protein n=1 Tax=Hydrogenispora ethanolica TaxID=1082276 RepID=A0A4R1RIP4_HYDET|nr:substrate-binding domain-containing protein [Hydrogenispora ethanolica]TCL65971.1 xylose-binding protein [Hydrogenispora ethanolica]
MSKRRSYGLLALALLGLTLLSGCSWWQAFSGARPIGYQPIRIGLAMATLQEERWWRDREYLAERARQLGAELIVQNANNEQQEQYQQVEYLLSRGIDVLVIVPHDLNQAAAAVQLAKKAGIKVISYDRLIRNANLDLYISFDNIKVGELMAEYLVNRTPNGNYVIINGAPTDNNCYMFNQGYKNVLTNFIKDGRIRITFEAWADDWKPEIAYQYIQTLLSQKKPFNAVIAANDSLASAVIEALSEWRLAGKILVVGHDADLSGCQRIVEGTQLMTVYKPIRKLAYRAADLAVAMAGGKNYKTNHAPIFNGKHFVPSEIITPIPIDKENMDIIVRDGFHRKSEIYMNVPSHR